MPELGITIMKYLDHGHGLGWRNQMSFERSSITKSLSKAP
jgi:hypothetical protein